MSQTSPRPSRPWSAAFISASTPATGVEPAPYFRREFDVQEGLQRAVLHVTALGIVVPSINGTRVGDEVLEPGWTPYRDRLIVRSHDVTELLRAGENAFGAIVGEGWAVGRLGWEGERHFYADRPALFAELELVYADRTDVIATDSSFRVGSGAVGANGIYDGETFDARAHPSGWDSPGYDDAAWQQAQPLEWPLEALSAPVAPPIRRIEELSPVSVVARGGDRVIVDFGQNLSGWVRLTVTGEAGRTITVRHAELVTPAGDLETESNRTAEATDRYILAGTGEETWEPAFTFHGFRYVEIEGWPGEVDPDAVRAVVVHTDMRRTGWFETSNASINRLHQNTVWSMRDNFVGVPTDCPQRDERFGWTGDLNAFAPTGVFLYDVHRVLGSWLIDLSLEQERLGTVPQVVPNALRTGSSATALWGDVAVSLPWLLYQEYGDADLLRRAYPSMVAFMTEVEQALDEHGLWSSGFQYGDWLDPDAPADNPAGGKTDAHLVASAYLCKTSRELAQTAQVLGEQADAERYAALASRVRDAFRREYVTAAGRVTDESSTAYALAILFGILDDDQVAKAGERLSELVAKSGYTISTGFAGTPLIADALSDTGHLRDAYALLLQEKSPSFLYPVTMGATTIWERWDAVLPDGTINATGMTSLNHYALGAVADWLHRVVGGLERVEPGWQRIRVAPRPGGGLTWARAAHDTIRGRAEVAWRVVNGEMRVDVTVPAGATAEVHLPLHPDDLIVEVGEGTQSWTYPARDAEEALTMQTPIKDLMRHDEVWAAVLEELRRALPGIPIEAGLPHMADLPLTVVLDRMPGESEELRRGFERILGGASAEVAR